VCVIVLSEDKKVSRRRFLKAGAAVAGVAVVGAAAYYAGVQSAAPPTQSATVTQTASVAPTTSVRTISFDIPSSAVTGPLTFNVWPFRPDIEKNDIDTFDSQYSEQVNFAEIAGDYNAVMSTKLMAKAPMDVFLAQLFQLSKYWSAGWLETIDDLPTLAAYKKDVYPKYQDAFVMDGHDLGLMYYNGWRAVLTNQAILEKAGMADDYPKNWSEVYDKARALKKGGYTDTPLGLWWSADYWIGAEQFEMEIKNDFGVELFDSNLEPVFDMSNAGEVLKRWVDAYNEGLVPKQLPSMSWGDYYSFLFSGKAAYFTSESYNMAALNDPKRSPYAGKCSLVPNPPNYAFGHYNTCAYVISKTRPRSDEQLSRAMRLLSFLGYRDKNGQLTVAKNFQVGAFLTSVFPEVAEDKDLAKTQAAQYLPYRGDEDYARYVKGFQEASYEKWWKAVWAQDFTIQLTERLPQAIIGKVSISDTIDALRKDVDDLKKSYGQ